MARQGSGHLKLLAVVPSVSRTGLGCNRIKALQCISFLKQHHMEECQSHLPSKESIWWSFLPLPISRAPKHPLVCDCLTVVFASVFEYDLIPYLTFSVSYRLRTTVV